MKKFSLLALVVGLGVLFLATESLGQRGGRGGGGRGGGGGARVGGGGGARPGGVGGGVGHGGTVHSYGGGVQSRGGTSVVGPGGGSIQAGRGGGSYTTPRGGTIDYKGAGIGGTTPGGIQAGRGVGGVQVTTPGGREVGRVGTAGGVSGPGGRAVGGRESVTAGTGPRGSAVGASKGGAAMGPRGGVAAGSKAGVAAGAGGAVVGGTRGAVAGGHYGAAATRSTVAAGRGTYYRSSTAIRHQGTYVRRSVVNYPCFRRGWYTRYPGAWLAVGWTGGYAWRAATWNSCATYCGIVAEPVYYDYGSSVVYQMDQVYTDGVKTASAAEYVEQATTIADTGREARVNKDEEWLPLGVFAMVQGEEQTSNHIFQLAVNKQGVIRGNYYDAVTDATSEVYGAVDKKTQLAAWTVGDKKKPIYEAGIANLTQDETTMMVHYDKDRSSQFTLIRVEDPEKEESN